jgi:hypothetical protein
VVFGNEEYRGRFWYFLVFKKIFYQEQSTVKLSLTTLFEWRYVKKRKVFRGLRRKNVKKIKKNINISPAFNVILYGRSKRNNKLFITLLRSQVTPKANLAFFV